MGLPESFCIKCGESVLVQKLEDEKEGLKKQLIETRRRAKKIAVDYLSLRSERDRLNKALAHLEKVIEDVYPTNAQMPH